MFLLQKKWNSHTMPIYIWQRTHNLISQTNYLLRRFLCRRCSEFLLKLIWYQGPKTVVLSGTKYQYSHRSSILSFQLNFVLNFFKWDDGVQYSYQTRILFDKNFKICLYTSGNRSAISNLLYKIVVYLTQILFSFFGFILPFYCRRKTQ